MTDYVFFTKGPSLYLYFVLEKEPLPDSSYEVCEGQESVKGQAGCNCSCEEEGMLLREFLLVTLLLWSQGLEAPLLKYNNLTLWLYSWLGFGIFIFFLSYAFLCYIIGFLRSNHTDLLASVFMFGLSYCRWQCCLISTSYD